MHVVCFIVGSTVLLSSANTGVSVGMGNSVGDGVTKSSRVTTSGVRKGSISMFCCCCCGQNTIIPSTTATIESAEMIATLIFLFLFMVSSYLFCMIFLNFELLLFKYSSINLLCSRVSAYAVIAMFLFHSFVYPSVVRLVILCSIRNSLSSIIASLPSDKMTFIKVRSFENLSESFTAIRVPTPLAIDTI